MQAAIDNFQTLSAVQRNTGGNADCSATISDPEFAVEACYFLTLVEGMKEGGQAIADFTVVASSHSNRWVMRHCIGQGAFDGMLDDSAIEFLSVRNSNRKPLATLEIRQGYIRQFRAKGNSVPSTAIH